MNYDRIVQGILDIGEAMAQSGAECFRLQDSLYRMAKSYGFVRYDIFAIPSNLQITVETPEGEIITQTRHIELSEMNLDRLDYLNHLCRTVCANPVDADELHEKFMEVMNRPKQKPYLRYVAGVMGGTGFAVFFGCDWQDAIVATIISIMIVAVGKWLEKRENNLLIYNAILSCLSETVIMICAKVGLGHHSEWIMIGIVMLLISGLGITNGIRDLLQRDFISGSIKIMDSILGAAGIAFGIAFAMSMFDKGELQGFVIAPNFAVQLISCTIACTGFAWWFKVKGKQVLYSSIGAFFTWFVYMTAYHFNNSNFYATIIGATFVAGYAFVMSRVNRAPSTIFLTASVFPLIPGPNLYYMMYGFVGGDNAMAFEQMKVLFETCLGIAFGFLIVDVISRVLMYQLKRDFHIGKAPQHQNNEREV